MTVLVLTHSGDSYVPELVMRAIEQRGAHAVRVDTDRLPREHTLTVTSTASMSTGARAVLDTGDDEIDLARVTGAWCRRLWTGALGVDVEQAFVHASVEQARDAWRGTVDALAERGARVVNDPARQVRAERKVLQMSVARAVGLAMPPTIVSNDPLAVRAFVDACHQAGAGVVTKMLVPLSQTVDASGPFVYTSDVDAHDLKSLADVRHAPMIFQQKIEKVREVRAVVVGDEVFAGAFAVRARDPLDWRVPRTDHIAWQKARVPPRVARAAVALVKRLGLVTGACDFVIDAKGAWWFLEVNPAGEWGWLTRDLRLPIADAIAAVLIPRSRRRA